MKLLLDTHVMVWWLRDNDKLGPYAKSAIADPDNNVMVSIISFWELSIKKRTGKFDDSGPLLFREALEEDFEIIGISADHLAQLEQLARLERHYDPFDHLILAQARSDGAKLLTNDKAMTLYDVPCMPAGR